MKITLAATAMTVLAASAASAEVSYQRYNGKVYGSDGTTTYDYNGKSYTRLPGSSKEIIRYEYNGKTYVK